MADRELTAAIVTEAETTTIVKSTVGFVLLDFDTDPVYVWTGTYPRTETLVSESSHTWTGLGDLGFIDGIIESANRASVNGVKLIMNGIANDLLSGALDQNYQGRAAKIWLAFLDGDEAIIATEIVLFNGQMDVLRIVDGDGQGAIEVSCESREGLLKRTSESLLTDEEQQRVFPGDLGLEFVVELQGKILPWGEKGTGDGVNRPRDLPGDNRDRHRR
jgi:hypothetical protein